MRMWKVYIEGQVKPFGVEAKTTEAARERVEQRGHKVLRVEEAIDRAGMVEEDARRARDQARDLDDAIPSDLGQAVVYEAEMLHEIRQTREMAHKIYLETRGITTPKWYDDKREAMHTLGVCVTVAVALGMVLGWFLISMCGMLVFEAQVVGPRGF